MRYELLEDCELMLEVKGGNQASFALLHERHRMSVERLLSRMTKNTAVAEELSQEVFLRVYQARDRYQPTASFTTWLYRIAFNRALNWLRSQRAVRGTVSYDIPDTPLRRSLADGMPTPERTALRQERIDTVRRAIASLPARQREALMLHKYGGLEYTVIAAQMGTSVPAVKSLLFRTYLTLHARLEGL